MKYLLILMLLAVTGCAALNENNNGSALLIVRIAVSEAIYKNDEPQSPDVCRRAARALEIAGQARAVVNNDLLALPDIQERLSEVITSSGLNPVTASILLDVGREIAEHYIEQLNAGLITEDARVSVSRVLDAVESTANQASSGCS